MKTVLRSCRRPFALLLRFLCRSLVDCVNCGVCSVGQIGTSFLVRKMLRCLCLLYGAQICCVTRNLLTKCINVVNEIQETTLRTLQIDSTEQSVAAVNRAMQDNPLRLIFALASSGHVPKSSRKRGVSFKDQ